MFKKILFAIIVVVVLIGGYFVYTGRFNYEDVQNVGNLMREDMQGGMESELHPLSIENLRNGEYPGSEIEIEQTLDNGSNYERYIVSYQSEGLKNYALLTVPNGEPPEEGYPAIIFNHGYIDPDEYRTTERYEEYTDGFSRNGYVLLRPDYRGHGNSEGDSSSAYGTDDYTIDILNAVSSVKKLEYVNSDEIGMWGHSMGGHITMRAMVVDPSIKAGVIWAGVVGPYPDPFLRGRGSELNPNATPRPTRPDWDDDDDDDRRRGWWRDRLLEEYGTYEEDTEFWNSLSAVGYLEDLAGPVQLHHGTNDTSVPVENAEYLEPLLEEVGKSGGVYIYPGDNHNISNNFNTAMNRSVEFFDTHVK